MKIIAIIPARKGSKRIIKKNIKEFLGKPIIAYSIEAAKNSELFCEIMVSTDDEEIATISRKYGAIVPFMRSKKNSDDFATTADVLLEVLHEYKKIDQKFDYLCCIYPTAPFLTVQKLKDSFDMLINNRTYSVIPVVKFSYPIQRAFRINNGCDLEYIWPKNVNKRSQDLVPSYHDAGQFYWIKTSKFFQMKTLITNKTLPYEIPEMEVQDIDTEDDWRIAEIKFQQMQKNRIKRCAP